MAKNSTLSSIESFISNASKEAKENASSEDQHSPSEAVISNILNFSKALRVEHSREAGTIEMVLN